MQPVTRLPPGTQLFDTTCYSLFQLGLSACGEAGGGLSVLEVLGRLSFIDELYESLMRLELGAV